MKETHQRASENQNSANPGRRWLITLRVSKKLSFRHEELHGEQQDARQDEAENRREQQCLADRDGLIEIDTGCAAAATQKRIGNANADYRSNQGMRTRRGQAQIPGAEVPDDRRDQE